VYMYLPVYPGGVHPDIYASLYTR